MKLQYFSGFPAVFIMGLVEVVPALVMVWRPHSTQCSNVNSGLNINQESTHTAWSCLDLTFLTPVEGKQTRPCQGFLLQTFKDVTFTRPVSVITSLFLTMLYIFPDRKELPGHGTAWARTQKQVPTGGWHHSWAPATYQSSHTGITDS